MKNAISEPARRVLSAVGKGPADLETPDPRCWEWGGAATPAGYGMIRVKVGGRWRNAYAHRVALSAVNPAFPLFTDPTDQRQACHRCDNPACVNPHHLQAADRALNHRDMVEKGRSRPRGKRRFITAAQKRELARAYAEGGVSYRAVGRRFGVCHKTVVQAVRDVQAGRDRTPDWVGRGCAALGT